MNEVKLRDLMEASGYTGKYSNFLRLAKRIISQVEFLDDRIDQNYDVSWREELIPQHMAPSKKEYYVSYDIAKTISVHMSTEAAIKVLRFIRTLEHQFGLKKVNLLDSSLELMNLLPGDPVGGDVAVARSRTKLSGLRRLATVLRNQIEVMEIAMGFMAPGEIEEALANEEVIQKLDKKTVQTMHQQLEDALGIKTDASALSKAAKIRVDLT